MGYPDQQPQQQPPQGGYPPPQQPQGGSYRNKAIAAMVLGIVAIVLVFILSNIVPGAMFISLVLSIIALVLGVQVRKAVPKGHPDRSMATAGFVLGLISLIVVVLTIVIVFAAAACLVGSMMALAY